jgi:hypothetical protein
MPLEQSSAKTQSEGSRGSPREAERRSLFEICQSQSCESEGEERKQGSIEEKEPLRITRRSRTFGDLVIQSKQDGVLGEEGRPSKLSELEKQALVFQGYEHSQTVNED